MGVSVRVAWLGGLPLVASGCIGGILGPNAADRLSAARSRWDDLLVETYEIDFVRGNCECLPASMTPVRLHVTLDSIVSATRLSDGQPISAEDLSLYFTVDDVFEQITVALSQDAFLLEVEYDNEFGFPRTVALDIDDTVADDEITYNLQNLEIVTSIPKNPSPSANLRPNAY